MNLKSPIETLSALFFASGFDFGPIILISFDVESPIDGYGDDIEAAKRIGFRNRIGLRRLIEVSKNYEVPFTLFSTGHALLKECRGHRTVVKIIKGNKKYGFHVGEYYWFNIDPASNYLEYPEFYYGDLIEEAIKLKVKHEVASHSFSHIPYPLVDDEVVLKDLGMSIDALNLHGLEMWPFAFPFNMSGKFYLLSKAKVKICRIGQRTFRTVSQRDGIIAVKTHITDLAIPSLKIWDKIIYLLIKNKTLLSWYLHPVTLYDYKNYKIFEEIIKNLVKKEIKIVTFKELSRIWNAESAGDEA